MSQINMDQILEKPLAPPIMNVKSYQVKTKKNYYHIDKIFPAFNQTFVLFGAHGQYHQDFIAHIDKQGKTLFQHKFDKSMQSFAMMTNKQALMAQTYKDCISILDLTTHQFIKVKHYFKRVEQYQTEIITFSQSKLVCIKELSHLGDNIHKLSYYQHPLKQNAKPVHVFTSIDDQWTNDHFSAKANNHSMFVWFKPLQQEFWAFNTYNLNEKFQGKMSRYKVKQTLGIPYSLNKAQIIIINMWEMEEKKFLFCCQSKQIVSSNQIRVQHILVLETETQNVRQPKFNFGQYQSQLYEVKLLAGGPYVMFKTFRLQRNQGISMQSPIFIVNIQQERVVAQQKWKFNQLSHTDVPGYSDHIWDQPNGVIIDSYFQQRNCKWFICSLLQINGFNMQIKKLITLTHMQKLNQDFDYDLMHDAFNLIF